MDSTSAERRRQRRTRAHTSHENLIKDSSSDVSPRDSSAPAASGRRVPRRPGRSVSSHEYDNQAFAEEEPTAPHSVDRVSEHDEIEEEHIREAERLGPHLAKEHQRKKKEIQQKVRTSSKTTSDDRDDLQEELREQQKAVAEHLTQTVEEPISVVEPIPTTMTTSRGRSLEKLLERAKKARPGQSIDEELGSTLGSSRRFAASHESRLQKAIRRHAHDVDASEFTVPPSGETTTRFDYDQMRRRQQIEEINRKQMARLERLRQEESARGGVLKLSEKDDFFLKVWPDYPDINKDKADKTSDAPVTTIDASARTESRVTDEPVPTDEPIPTDADTTRTGKRVDEDKEPLIPPTIESQLVQYQRPEITLDEDEQRLLDEKKFKYVIGQKFGLQTKFGDGVAAPRSLEQEGIYVGKRPVVPANLVRRAEKRILQECDVPEDHARCWFGPDGAIISLPDPTKFVPTRPLMDELFDHNLSKEFHKAFQMDTETGLSDDPTGFGRYRLDIDIGTITFIHHYLMNLEQVLAMKLKEMYEHYKVRRQQRIVHLLSEKIKALKSAEQNAQTLYEQNKYNADKTVVDEFLDRLRNYQNELQQARNERCNEMKTDRDLLQLMLNVWKQIKEVRRSNGFTTTPTKLIIKQISGKKTKHYEQMQQEIEEEIADEIALAKEKYEQEKAEHSRKVASKRLQSTRKKEAKKRLEKKRASTKETGDGEVEYDEKDIAILNEPDDIVPEKPEPRKPDEIRAAVLEKYKKSIRPPNEPEVLLELETSEMVTPDSECIASERARRTQVQNSSAIRARILINGKAITDTPVIQLSNEFVGHLKQIFPCYVLRTPDAIKIEFYESTTRFRSPLAELYLPIPEPSVTSDNCPLQPYEFSSDALRVFNSRQTTAIGSGILEPIELSDPPKTYLNIEGILTASVAWGVHDDVVLIPPDYATSKAHLHRQMGGGTRQDINLQAVNLNNMKNLIEWIKQSNLDPYDPDNAFLLSVMKDYMNTRANTNFELNSSQHFRLSTDGIDDFLTDMDIDSSLRFKVLQARKANLPGFKDYRPVPSHDYLVRKKYNFFKKLLSRQDEASYSETYEQYQGKRPTRIDVARRDGEKHLRKMREQVAARFDLTVNRKSLEDMVVEENVPNIQIIRGMLARFYIEPVRPLYPTRRRADQKKVANLALAANREVFILVNIMGATDLPYRTNELEKEKTAQVNRGKQKPDIFTLLRPYVEIQFQQETFLTNVADGPNPSWNQELPIPFKPKDNDFDPSSLQRCRDVLYVNVFDACHAGPPTAGQDDQSTHEKTFPKNWIGSIKIPFTNIYVNKQLEGSYALSIPSPLLGYSKGKVYDSNDQSGDKITTSLLRMFMTIEPLLPTPESFQQSFDSTESFQLLSHARTWVEELNKKYPDRDYKATVTDVNGRAVFIPRFIRPLTPIDVRRLFPDSEMDDKLECKILARFVSLIPFLADAVTFPGVSDIWETSDQFLRTMVGDDEEHAVLLNNYFLSKNMNSWIALGASTFSGPCCFVLTKDANENYPTCWSVSDGRNARTTDPWNPIRSIYLLANEQNIWANIQASDIPSRMSFNINNTSHWRPFFTGSFQRDASNWFSVQPLELRYEKTEVAEVQELRDNIHDILRAKMTDWRLPALTSFNPELQNSLRQLMTKHEIEFIRQNTVDTASLEKVLAGFRNTHEINGFSLQMPYSTIQAIVDAVNATKVHEYPGNLVRFALAVHIHPYPNNVLAVWIYMARLVPKQTL